MTNKEIRDEIKSVIAGLPNREISSGHFVEKVGYKYVTIMSTWGNTTFDKVPLEYFDGVSINEGYSEWQEDNCER